ncbi:MAG: PCRF domain-containing protein, partial [Bacteroidota bacterium]|nr:PCRF domain-containing protein [Bacteroidota bacterium]
MDERIDALVKRFEELGARMSTPEVLGNRTLYTELAKERGRLEPIVEAYERLRRLRDEIRGHREILSDESDETLLALAREELHHLTEEEAAIHPQRNVLYRALGQGDAFTPDVTTAPLPEAGYLLMCSDGLWGVVPQSEIVRIVNASSSPQIACQRLV